MFFGGGPNHDRLGFRYWKHPGAFKPYLVKGNTGRFLDFWTGFIKSGFSFIFSPELITAAAGEAVAPRRNIPKATKRFIYRLIAFYVLGALVIGVTVAYNDPKLLSGIASGSSGAGASPFVVAIQNAGIKGLNHVINAAILTSAWSSGNSWLFAGSRTLYSLACEGQAPKIFARCNRKGIPYVSVLFTWLIACIAYLNVSSSGATVFYWFTNITTVGGFISWIVLLVAYLVRLSSFVVGASNMLIKTTEIPRRHEISRHTRFSTIQNPSSALQHILCSIHRVPSRSDEWLLCILPRKFHRIQLPGVIHRVRHLHRFIHWP